MPRVLIACLIFVIYFFVSVTPIIAQVTINEVFNNPVGSEKGAEWVELVNLSQQPTTLRGCTLYLDDSSVSQKVVFSDSDFVERFKVISWDGSWLNNSGDLIKLNCGTFKDEIVYGDLEGSIINAPHEGVSIGRYPDSTGSFSILSAVTLGNPNQSPPTATNTSAPSPTHSPKPTSTPKPNTPTQTPKSPAVSKPAEITTILQTPATVSPLVLGQSQGMPSSSEIEREKLALSSTPFVLADKEMEVLPESKVPISVIIMSALGLISILFSVFVAIKNYQQSEKTTD